IPVKVLLPGFRLRLKARLATVVAAVRPAPRSVRRRSARAVVGWFAAVLLLLHVGAVLATDVAWPELRDPEYGRRAKALRERVREHPTRPLVLVVGSSRSAMGVRPGAWEAARPGTARDPLLFNMATLGSGPIQELLALRRVYADGFRPAVVLIEYWPP